MNTEEYVDKTRGVTKFLIKVFDGDINCVANIFQAQATQDTATLIAALTGIKEQIEEWIDELKPIAE